MYDTAPFEPFMPDLVRGLIAEARSGRGLAAAWLAAEGWLARSACEALFSASPRPSDEELGWIAGITTFATDFRRVAPYVEARARGAAPHVVSAFVAGLRGNVQVVRHQWSSIEAVIALLDAPPDELLLVLPSALASASADDRAAAMRIARRMGPRVRPALERAMNGARGKARKHLEEALGSILPVEQKTDDLLPRLLKAWGETFDPTLVPFIVERGAEEARRRGPIVAKSKAEVENAWHAVAARRDPADVDRLLGTAWPGVWRVALRRCDALSEFARDPRIARAMPEIAKAFASIGSAPFRRAAAALATMEKPKISDAPAALIAEARASSRPKVDLDAVWASFREDPTSDARRLVLADALQTAGDPRGELITLSYAPKPDAAVRKRIAQLLEENVDKWTGPLPGVVRGERRFERGFLTAVRLKTRARLLASSADDPVWLTVEELHLESDPFSDEDVAAVSRVLANARALHTFVNHRWRLVDQLTGPFPQVRTFGQWDPPEGPIAAFPGLEMVGMCNQPPAAALEWVKRAGARRLLLFQTPNVVGALRAFDASDVLEARFVVHGPYGVPMEHTGFCLRVQKATPCAELVWGTGRYQPDTLRTLLMTLVSEGRTEIVVTLPKTNTKLAREELATFRVEGVTVREDEPRFSLWRAEPLRT